MARHWCREPKLELVFSRKDIERLPSAAPRVGAAMKRHGIAVKVRC